MSEYNIQMNKYNALNAGYDQLYPATKIENVDGLDMALQNKAPAGYGLGEYMPTLISDCNTMRNGWYRVEASTANIPSNVGLSNGVLRIDEADSDLNFQSLYFYSNGRAYEMKRKHFNGVWYPWEWVNPPMEIGVEYRTTERYQGKPVYVKMVDCGAISASATKTVAHNISNLCYLVGFFFTMQTSAYTEACNLPVINYNSNTGCANIIGSKIIIVTSGSHLDHDYSYAIIKYTKTTD